MKTNNPKQALILFLMVIGLFLLQSQLVLGEITLNDKEGTEFIVNQPPEYQGQTSQNTQVSVTEAISAQNIVIRTVQEVSAISCHFSSNIITITNNNNDPITTTVQSDKDFATFNKFSTFVMPGQTNEIIMYFRPACGKDTDTSHTLTFETGNITQTIRQDVKGIHTSNIAGTFANTYANTCPTENLRYTAKISNPAPFSDTYKISADTFSDYVTILPANFVLSPGEEKDITIIANFPKTEYGNRTIPLRIETINNKYQSTVELFAEIDRCYNFALAGPATISACEDGFITTTNYIITNLASFSNAYDLRIENKPQFMQIGGEYIELDSNQSGIIPISLEPNTKTFFGFFEQTRVGNYSTTLIAESYAGDVIAEKDINVSVEACYAHEFVTESDSYQICSADEGIPFSIENNGAFEETYRLSLESTDPAGVYLQNELVTIDANNFSTEFLYINQENLSDSAEITISATLANNSKVSESVDISLDRVSDKTCYDVSISPTKITIDREENITEYIVPITVANNGIRASNYSLSLDNQSDFIQINQTHVYLRSNEAKNLTLTATITNETTNGAVAFISASTNGFEDTTQIKVYYDSTFPWWVVLLILFIIILLLVVGLLIKNNKKKDKSAPKRKGRVSKLSRNVPKQTKQEKRKEKKEQKSGLWWILLLLFLLIAALFVLAVLLTPLSEEAGINETNQTNESTTPVINESVNQTGNQSQSESVFNRIGEWFQSLFDQENATAMNATNETPIQMNDSTRNQNQTNTTQEDTTTVFDGIAKWFNSLFEPSNETVQNETTPSNATAQKVSACPDVAEMKAFITENNLTNNFTYQIVPKNAIVEIDLSTLFIDPDNDTLTYAIEDMDNITTTIINSTGFVIPEEDFCGVRTTRIIAIDPQGASATSPEITFVIDEKPSLTTYFVSMRGIIILATILIIAMIVATILWLKE